MELLPKKVVKRYVFRNHQAGFVLCPGILLEKNPFPKSEIPASRFPY